MKLTKRKLKQLIKEELQVVLNEQSIDARGRQQFRNYSGQNYALDYQNGWKNKLAELGTNQDEVKKAIRALGRGEKQFINKAGKLKESADVLLSSVAADPKNHFRHDKTLRKYAPESIQRLKMIQRNNSKFSKWIGKFQMAKKLPIIGRFLVAGGMLWASADAFAAEGPKGVGKVLANNAVDLIPVVGDAKGLAEILAAFGFTMPELKYDPSDPLASGMGDLM